MSVLGRIESLSHDTYGHLQGDRALRLIADSMRLSCKGITKGTILARYGGDEFVILTALSGEDEGMDLKQRIVSNLAEIAAIGLFEPDLYPSPLLHT